MSNKLAFGSCCGGMVCGCDCDCCFCCCGATVCGADAASACAIQVHFAMRTSRMLRRPNFCHLEPSGRQDSVIIHDSIHIHDSKHMNNCVYILCMPWPFWPCGTLCKPFHPCLNASQLMK